MSIRDTWQALLAVVKQFLGRMTKAQIKSFFPSAKYSGKNQTWYINGKAIKAENIRFSMFW